MPEMRLHNYTAWIADLIETSQYALAVDHCQHILGIYPKHVQTLCLLGQACLGKGMSQLALGLFQRSLGADPENVAARVGLATIHAAEGSLPEAVWHMERAYEFAPGDTKVRSELQRMYVARDGEAPELKLTRGGLARLYARNGMYGKAVTEFKAILQQDPDLPHVRVAIAEALWHEGRRVEAVESCLDLLDVLPNCLKAHLILGEVWMRSGHEDAGREKLDLARALDPENTFAEQMMGSESPLPPQEIIVPVLQTQSESSGLQSALRPPPSEPSGSPVDRKVVDGAAAIPGSRSPEDPILTPRPGPEAGVRGQASATEDSGTPADEDEAPVKLPDWLLVLADGEVASPDAGDSAELAGAVPGEQPLAGQDWDVVAVTAEAEPSTEQMGWQDTPLQQRSAVEDLPDWLLELAGSPSKVTGREARADTEAKVVRYSSGTSYDAKDLPEWLRGAVEAAARERIPEEFPEREVVVEADQQPRTESGQRKAEQDRVGGESVLSWDELSPAAPGVPEEGAGLALEEQQDPTSLSEREVPSWVLEMQEIAGQEAPYQAAATGAEEPAGDRHLTGDLHTQPEPGPADARARVDLARLLGARGDLDRAMDHYDAVIRSGQLLPQVIADLKRYESEAQDPVRLYLLVGDAQRQAGQLEEALGSYRQARQAWIEHQT